MMRLLYTSLVLIVNVGVLGCKRAHHVEDHAGVVTVSSTGIPAAAVPVLLDNRTPGWQQNEVHRYRMQMSSKIAFGDKAVLYDFDMTGMVEVVPTQVAPETVSFYVGIEGAKFISRIPGSQEQFDKIAYELRRPYFFEMKGGLVTSSNMPKDLHPMAVAAFRTIGASLQFAQPQQQQDVYVAKEYDTTGQYIAEYRRLASRNSWQKYKQKYLGILLGRNQGKEARNVIPEVVRSHGEIQLSDDGRPTSVSMSDEVLLKDAQSPIRSKTDISLAEEHIEVAAHPSPDWKALREGTITVAADVPFDSQFGSKDLDDAKVNGMTFDKVLVELERLEGHPVPKVQEDGSNPAAKQSELKKYADEEAKLFVALGAIFRRQPESVKQALRKIQDKSSARDILVDGLGSADSSGAQQALIRLAENKANDDRLRTRALISLSRTEHPSQESVKALINLVDNEILGTQALYGIGSFCSTFTDSGQKEVAAQLGDFLIKRLLSDSRAESRLIVDLRAIGNSGYSPALPKLKPFLLDQRDQLRVDAVRALHAMDAPAVDQTLVERLANDASKQVRMAAVEAMAGRAPSDLLVKSLQEASTEVDPHVRYRAVELLIRWLPKRTDVKQSIESVARNDDEQKIRELAKAAL